ncbi:TPA: hypothetical protein L9K38_001434 [Klebsiella pneumoniae]|uniref:hypothetical protein n=1 Tax=Klebsiella pneumoniae TaxID=573 RepID=UPI000C7C70EB|nr:hypothetical protein [Klebsiella pneumoniae]EIY5116774.1 hypothetical protein [Klebsiella quasipneumoniae]HBT4714300.1 hypothetical protein [Klebsiella quasipneumoniae subsp. quasipneumoniae]EMC2649516.1 hypothetical protein [Klebsiella pneumoniae]MBC5538599.1 hypothetical protein [Klebsiella pneumoniae]MBZ1877689.1 hypothetical protein [Klebsiella pneumoniae]
MEYSKLFSTLTFVSSVGEQYKYEIYQERQDSSFYAVISAKQEIDTEKYGRSECWVEIESRIRLQPSNPMACEEECKAHFLNSF